MSEEETYIIKENTFSIDNIIPYLVNIKNILIKMNIKLDSQEINKFLAESLNNSLFGYRYNKNTAFQFIIDNWNEITSNKGTIENQIREFNKKENYKYYVNMEDVVYLAFYKQINYTREIIAEALQYLNFGVNPIYIYTFIIQSFYDEKLLYDNYIYFIGKLRDDINDEKINSFLSKNTVEKLEKIMKTIFENDIEFNKLMSDIFNDRISFIKEGIITTTLSYPNNYNCKEIKSDTDNKNIKTKEPKKTQVEHDIEKLETHFYKLKCDVLFKKRQFNLSETFYQQINELFPSENSIKLDLWLAFVLFLYKKFDFKYEEFKTKIDPLIDSKGADFKEYKPNLDYFDDLKVPKYEYVSKTQIGGNKSYHSKYLKYKTKYLNLKIKKTIN
jgi:hypothetical protein